MLSLLLIGQLLGKLEQQISNIEERFYNRLQEVKKELHRTIENSARDSRGVAEVLVEHLRNDFAFFKQSNEEHEKKHHGIDNDLMSIRNEIRRATSGEDFSAKVPGVIRERIERLEREVEAIDAERTNLFTQYENRHKEVAEVTIGLKTKVSGNDLKKLEKKIESKVDQLQELHAELSKVFLEHMVKHHPQEPAEETKI